MLSGGVLPHIFLNVPFSTTLLSDGAAVLFLLWYITPRAMFGGTAKRARSLAEKQRPLSKMPDEGAVGSP